MIEKYTSQKLEPNKPLEEYTYDQYPNMVEFERPWESCIQVAQGNGKLSLDGQALQSEGFSKCCALILQNTNSNEAALFHISDIDLNHRQCEILSQLEPNSTYDGLFIKGAMSRDLKERIIGEQYFSDHVRLNSINDIEFDTDKQHWDIVYKPKERKVYLNSRSQKKILVFSCT